MTDLVKLFDRLDELFEQCNTAEEAVEIISEEFDVQALFTEASLEELPQGAIKDIMDAYSVRDFVTLLQAVDKAYKYAQALGFQRGVARNIAQKYEGGSPDGTAH